MQRNWLRAFRSTALHQRQLRWTRRRFHTSIVVRAPEDSNNNGPRDDGNKPGKNSASEHDQFTSENVSGGNGSTIEESQGRKRPGNGSFRTRTSRGRKPEELPPVRIPKTFIESALYRSGATTPTETDLVTQASTVPYSDDDPVVQFSVRVLSNPEAGISKFRKSWTERNDQFLDSFAFFGEHVRQFSCDFLDCEDPSPFLDAVDLMIGFAWFSMISHESQAFGHDSVESFLRRTGVPDVARHAAAFHAKLNDSAPPEYLRLLLDSESRDNRIRGLPYLLIDRPRLLDEIVNSVRAEILLEAPNNSKLTDLQRPVTIINVQDYRGLTRPKAIVRHVAESIGADVLHLTAGDIADILGKYLGQDAARAPGSISLLGYKAAGISGRLRERSTDESEDRETDDSPSLSTIVLRGDAMVNELMRRKSHSSLVDSLSRGKSDELWVDFKVNTALEEIISVAEPADQKPLIIHLHDFNALNLDLDCGAVVVGKLRKAVDELWLEGRKIVLVGTASSKGAPKPYLLGLRELESKERVLSTRPLDAQKHRTFKKVMSEWEKHDFFVENDENICRTLNTILDVDSKSHIPAVRTLGLAQSTLRTLHSSSHLGNDILPIAGVYHLTTAIVGLARGDSSKALNLMALHSAMQRIYNNVSALGTHGKSASINHSAKQKTKKGGFVADLQRQLMGGDHEERFKSAMVNAEDIRTTFDDVHAPKETIESVKMLTSLSLLRPEAFSYGVLATERIPGCLLYGPPGTGKTLLAKAVAKESGANMIEVSGANINNMYVGESEKNVQALFSVARKKEPMIIFIDEADALLGSRGGDQRGGNKAARATINQFLREWDGLNNMKAFIMVATNRPFDLDEAVLRRLPRKLLVDLPLEQDRASILQIHLKNELLDDTVSLADIAKRTPLYSGSDLKNVCVAAAMAAVKEEMEAADRHTGPDPYEWGKKRVLANRHFEKGLAEIGASVSEDMATLTGIRKFDERYGDGRARWRRKVMGFGTLPDGADADTARIRRGSDDSTGS